MISDYGKQFLLESTVPPGTSGKWRVEYSVVSPEKAKRENLRIWMNQSDSDDRSLKPGTYVRLFNGKKLWMSDTPAELKDHLGFVSAASGRVLITGLGLGVVVSACLRNPRVTSVTVVEKSKDVILLVGPTLRGIAEEYDREYGALNIVCADAFTWQPSGTWDFAWHDIWINIKGNRAKEYRRIMKKYAPYVSVAQECWQEANVFAMEEEDDLRRALGGNISVKKAVEALEGFKV